MERDDALDLLKNRGWDRITGAWNADHREAEPVLMENAYLIRIARPATPVAGQGGQALGGSVLWLDGLGEKGKERFPGVGCRFTHGCFPRCTSPSPAPREQGRA
jgi:hypothetical protein